MNASAVHGAWRDLEVWFRDRGAQLRFRLAESDIFSSELYTDESGPAECSVETSA